MSQPRTTSHFIKAASLAFMLLAAACAPSKGAAPPNGPIVSPYVDVTVEEVRAKMLPLNPPQVQLLIRGTLPDMCTYEMYAVESRGENSISITLQGRHPADMMCAQELQTIEYTWLLGKDLPEAERSLKPGTYQLTVNRYETTISIP